MSDLVGLLSGVLAIEVGQSVELLEVREQDHHLPFVSLHLGLGERIRYTYITIMSHYPR